MGGAGAERRTCIDIDQNNSVVFFSNTGSDLYCPFLPSTYPLTDPGSGAYFDNTLPSGGDFAELIISKLQMPQLQTNANSVLPITCGSCDGSIAINVTSGDGSYTYEWSNGLIQSNVSDTISTINNLCSGNYSVVVSSVNYCNLSDSLSFSLLAPTGGLTIEVTPDNTTITNGESVQLNASGATFYSWTPSIGLSCDTCSNPIAAPTLTTSYFVTGIDTNGCTGDAEVIVRVNEIDIVCSELFIPTIFSPNGKGPQANETFCVFSDCVEQFKLVIHNRWGERIFESEDINQCWDGKFKGLEAASGVYAFNVYLKQLDGTLINKIGNISLVR
jgi:gliding motility-associated-like protein